MNNYYGYVAPDYKILFGIGGDWLTFEDKSFRICGELKDGDWKLKIYTSYLVNGCCYSQRDFDDLPYETLVSFRKALGIKGLEWVLDKKVTLLEEEK